MQSRPLIMVVEDDESIRNQLSDALPRLGFDVTVAADGLDALEILDTTVQPDLILSDIVMPGMSGIDLKKELAQSDRLASIPFVFVSALSSLRHVRKGMQLAADDYVTKPFRLSELKAVLDAQLEKAQARSRHFNKSSQELVESHSCPEVCWVHSEKALLGLALKNIISNAMKFSDSTVSVLFTGPENTGSFVTVEVRDQGIGIPVEDMVAIFNPFFRAGNASRFSGTGIGLALVKGIVNLLNCSIQVDSAPGKGTIISMRIPVHG
ncbi:MAG: hybrid sensor histidine kinase/response regulator [Rhodothermales bacterium]